MAIKTLNNPIFISIDNAGQPNSAGTVEVYTADGLFTTLAILYSDQIRTSEISNPVTLNGDGTREIWYDTKVDIKEKRSDGVLIRDTLNIDPNAGNAVVQSFNLASNGSFEVDSDNDGQPDNWTITPYTGSAIAITNDVVTDGVEALEFNTAGAGTGGGTATSAKFPVTEGTTCSVSFSVLVSGTSAETSTSTFVIKWYDEDSVYVSSSTVTVTHVAVDTWYHLQQEVTVAATATQGEIVLVGVATGGAALTSKAYFDGISIINDPSMVTLGTAQSITGVKTMTSPVLTTPTVTATSEAMTSGGSPVYGMIILDTIVNLVTNAAAADDTWINYVGADLSGLNAKIAIVYIQAVPAAVASTNMSVELHLRKAGTVVTNRRVGYVERVGTTSESNYSGIGVEATVALDATGHFDYKFDYNGAGTGAVRIDLLGYYT